MSEGVQAYTLRRDKHAANAVLTRFAPRVPWDRFYANFHPQPGEHLAIIGPTGRGKTEIQNQILPKYHFVAVFATKPIDETMERLIVDGGYTRLQRWRSLNLHDYPRRVIWPDASQLNSQELQKEVFADALDKIFREGGRPKKKPVGWATAVDELWFIVNMLGLGKQIKMFLFQGRSLGISLILATQRPADVPLEVYDQSTHLFFLRDNDDSNIERLAKISSLDSGLVRFIIPRLEDYQTLYVNTRTGKMIRTRTPIPLER